MSNQSRECETDPESILDWAGFACWTMIVLFPLLYWVNGPSVSTDQLVVRTALIILAVGGAIGSRLAKRKERTGEECMTKTVTESEDRTLEKS